MRETIYGIYFDTKSGTGWTLAYERTGLRLQWRSMTAGVWSGWWDLHDFGINPGTGTAWSTYDTVLSRMDVFENVQLRLIVIQTHTSGTTSSNLGDTWYSNIDAVTLVARALVR